MILSFINIRKVPREMLKISGFVLGFQHLPRDLENVNEWKIMFDQDQDQDSLLVKRRNDNHSPGPVIRELVPSSHQRSELSNTILCIFSG